MKRILVLILTAALSCGFSGCGSNIGEESDSMEITEEVSDDIAKQPRVNYEEDAYALMGMDYQAFLQEYEESKVVDFFDKESAAVHEADYYYVLSNGVEAGIYSGKVISVRTFYNRETEEPVPVLKGIGGGDKYDAVVAKFGEPYYEAPERVHEEETEYVAAVFYIGEYQYIKVYFDKATESVSFIYCLYGEAPAQDIQADEAVTILTAEELYDFPLLRADWTEEQLIELGFSKDANELTGERSYSSKTLKYSFGNIYGNNKTPDFVDVFGISQVPGPRGIAAGDSFETVLNKFPQEKDWQESDNGEFYGEVNKVRAVPTGLVLENENGKEIVIWPQEQVPCLVIFFRNGTLEHYRIYIQNIFD